MKKYFLSVIFLLTAIVSFSQTDSLLTWQVTAQRIADSVYTLKATATVPPEWHLYGANPNIEGLESVQVTYDYENAKKAQLVAFSGNLQQINDPVFDNKKVNIYTGNVTITQQFKISGVVPEQLKGTITAFLGKKDEFQPAEYVFTVHLEGGMAASANSKRLKLSTIDINHPINNCGAGKTEATSLWTVFLLGFVGGLIALLTPCVFPMIPVTVSFFTKRSNGRAQTIRNGMLYGFFIFLIYTIASTPFHIVGNVQPEIFNTISTNAWLNILFFVIFIVFAISFFGFFDITLPSSIAGKADAKSGLGSAGGIFFMALTLVIVSFSCTGVILGTLLVGTARNGAWPLTYGMAGFGLALAFPFGLFAIFPHWLKALPKSGGWLDTVKKVLAFIEVALAFKFLSNADLVMHWGLLKREVFFGLWILIGVGLTLYLFGVLRLPHDYKGMKIGNGRKIVGILALIFTLYLLPGVTSSKYANIQLLSGFPPPLTYSIYGKENVIGKGLEANVVNDYDKALQMAREQHKPILIDFTGWACVNCRKMEENVWTQPGVYNFIKNNFILVSLYVDDRQLLPVEQRFTYKTSSGYDKEIKTAGDKWATFQAENFTKASQPLYAILDNNEKLVNHPVGYTPDSKEYLQWLQCGRETFLSVK